MMRRSLLALTVAALAAPTHLARAQSSQLQGVVGLWGPHADGDRAIVTDGARWNGTVAREAATTTGVALFGGASPSYLANVLSPTAFPLAVDRSTREFGDGTLRVQFKLISGTDDRSGGIVFGLGPSGEYRYVRYNTKDGNLALWAFRNGNREALAKGEGLKQLPSGTWHELVVRIAGREVHASVTGHPELDARFTVDAPVRGRVGLWAKRDVVTAFQRFGAEAASR